MSMTDHYQPETEYTDAPRRRRNTNPAYMRSVFERPEIRALVADACQAQINALQEGLSGFGTGFVVHQLDEVINELRDQG